MIHNAGDLAEPWPHPGVGHQADKASIQNKNKLKARKKKKKQEMTAPPRNPLHCII